MNNIEYNAKAIKEGLKVAEIVMMKRGISKEQVCALCAMDRAGNLITEFICKGRIKHTDLERLFGDTPTRVIFSLYKI